MQNNQNRWYDASVGRWLSEDPIGFAAGDANLYRYVGNGPVNGTGPSGLDPAFAPHISMGSPFYTADPVLPIEGAIQEPQYIGVCLGAYGTIGAGTVFITQTYFPAYLYHFTSEAGYTGIIGSGVINTGSGLYGTGVYASSFNSAWLARLMGAAATDRCIVISPEAVRRFPTLFPGTWIISNPVIVDPGLNPVTK